MKLTPIDVAMNDKNDMAKLSRELNLLSERCKAELKLERLLGPIRYIHTYNIILKISFLIHFCRNSIYYSHWTYVTEDNYIRFQIIEKHFDGKLMELKVTKILSQGLTMK